MFRAIFRRMDLSYMGPNKQKFVETNLRFMKFLENKLAI